MGTGHAGPGWGALGKGPPAITGQPQPHGHTGAGCALGRTWPECHRESAAWGPAEAPTRGLTASYRAKRPQAEVRTGRCTAGDRKDGERARAVHSPGIGPTFSSLKDAQALRGFWGGAPQFLPNDPWSPASDASALVPLKGSWLRVHTISPGFWSPGPSVCPGLGVRVCCPMCRDTGRDPPHQSSQALNTSRLCKCFTNTHHHPSLYI